MRLVDLYCINGRNVYSHKPITKLIVELGPNEEKETKYFPRFNSNLLTLLPGIKEHTCSKGYPGGFVDRLTEGTYLPHVLEHVVLEVQSVMGYDIKFGKARKIEGRKYSILVGMANNVAGLEACKLAFEIVNGLMEGNNISIEEKIKEISRKIEVEGPGPSTKSILNAAARRGIPINYTGLDSLYILGYGKYAKKIQASVTENTSNIAVEISCDKMATKRVLNSIGLSVPYGIVTESEEEAVEWAKEFDYPVVIKPLNGNQGKGVTLNLTDGKEVRGAFRIAKTFSEKVIIEKNIIGKHYRVLVINDQVVAVAERIPPFVLGDGKRTIKELVDLINSDPNRGEGHEKSLTKIKIDPVIHMVLAKKNLTLNYIPPLGEKIFLRENANLSTGGIAIDVTDKIHPHNKIISVIAAKALGLDVAGVDLVIEDIESPMDHKNGAIIEVNTAPGLRMHLSPSEGVSRDIGDEIVNSLFPVESEHSIPIVSVTGTNGKTTTVKLISHILSAMGYNIVSTSTDGILLNGALINEGDLTGPQGAKMALLNPVAEGVVLETARGGIIKGGLAYDLADVSVITNIAEDHLEDKGIETLEDLAWVKSLVVEATKDNGKTVLNADDPIVSNMALKAPCEVVLYSTQEDNVTLNNHIRKGETGFYIERDKIVLAKGRKRSIIAKVADIPITWGGKAIHNINNVLAASAAAHSLGVPIGSISRGLKSFQSNIHNPGRINFYQVGGFTVVVDYGHNEAGYANVLSFLKKITKGRLIGIIGVPGDRKDIYIKKTAKMAAQYLDLVIVKEDDDLRGRDQGEVARIIESALGDSHTKTILNEVEALNYGMELAKDDDIIVVFYEKLEPIQNAIEKAKTKYKIKISGVTAG